jgi:hypothetical protein
MLLFSLGIIGFLVFAATQREPSTTPSPTLLPPTIATGATSTAGSSPQTAGSSPPTAVSSPQTAVSSPQTAVSSPQTAVNGIPASQFIILPEGTVENIRAIYATGQSMGNNPQAFSKVGDSTSIYNFMNSFDEGNYNLANYAYLQETLSYFQGSHSRDGLAVSVGLHAWTAIDPAFANKDVCAANETPVACEIRLHRPAFLFIRLGTNDAGATRLFDSSIRQIVDIAISNGVIPIIGTKADRVEGSNANNDILRQVAYNYQIPLWDFDVIVETVPGRGIVDKFYHISVPDVYDYAQPATLQTGHGVHSLTALMMLDALLDLLS